MKTAARGQDPPGIRAAMHPGWAAPLRVAPGANSSAIPLSPLLAGSAPHRSRCPGGLVHALLGESIRRRRSSKDNGRPRKVKPRRVALPAWKPGARRRRALKWPSWKPNWGWRPDWERKWKWKPGGERKMKRKRKPPRGDLKWRPGTPALFLILAAIGLGSGYIVSTTWLFPSPEPPPAPQGVPDLRGSPLVGALALLADSGLTAGRVDSIRHPLAPAGSVIGQSPLPGRTALPGAEVRVTMSMGPEIRSVPDVTRLHGERAAATLEAGGFLVQVDTVESQSPAGRIVAIEPPPGTETTMPGSVLLQVSQGPPTFPMPSLLGFGELEARSLLAALGLTVSEIDRRYSIMNVNRVFGQNPAPNADVGAGTRVRLIVGQSMGWTLYEPSSGVLPGHSERSRGARGGRRGEN